MKNAIFLIVLLVLFGCHRKSLRENPTYKLSKEKGIVTDATFLFVASANSNMSWPDIHCFDSTGEPILPYNCANSLSKFVKDLTDGDVRYLDTVQDLKHFLDSNRYYNPDGERVLASNLPKRKFYVFYHYLYVMIEGTKDDSTILQRIRAAQKIARERNVLLYLATQTSEEISDR